MSENELLTLLTLQHTPNLGDGTIKKFINIFGSAEEVLRQKKSTLLKIDGVGEHKLSAFGKEEYYAFAKAELQYIHDNNIQYATYTDPHYPQKLKHCIDGPILLFSRGNIDWNNPRIISIVGTRKITTYGTAFLEKLIADIAPLNPLIISGFAYGVDITAHKACVEHGVQNVGVLAHGLNQIYPKVHSKYTKAVEANGGFVTDFWSSDSFVHTNFLQRNRIIAGLSEATIVIESAAKGGSLVTAEFANGYNRDVFAVPGRADDKQSLGCNNLIKQQKAHLMTSAADLLYILNWKIDEAAPKVIQKQLFVELTEEEKIIWRFLNENGKEQLDIIALNCKLPTFKIASLLLQMEMKGVIRALPGKQFELV
ncbi:DNA-protecting protein DprA [Dokdonia sinensis]|uniref:DNA-protecting protein DprA n=1 Tax=Dokdonia sinensis TaxID=2479847 RepID=A0A3M0GEY8_9FLAO|nr:DNA-processing protein DprA [Dokdonia sinensis]RMB63300.1 DNA-protecting protein DprA [Dokdonia sinensis]